MEYNQFDKVVIKTTKNVGFVSGPSGKPADPRGEWSIVGFRGNNTVILAKDSTIISTDISNIRRIMQYDVNMVFNELEKVNNTIKKNNTIKAKNNGKSKR